MTGAAVPFERLLWCQDMSAAGRTILGNVEVFPSRKTRVKGRWRGKQGATLGPDPTPLPLGQFLLLTSTKGGLGPYGARHIQHQLHSQPCPLSSVHHNIQVSPPSGHPLLLMRTPSTAGYPVDKKQVHLPQQGVMGGGRGKGGQLTESIFALTYNL